MNIICDNLEAAIENTNLPLLRKITYRSLLKYKDGQIVISRTMKELMSDFIRKEEIAEIKKELIKIESEEF